MTEHSAIVVKCAELRLNKAEAILFEIFGKVDRIVINFRSHVVRFFNLFEMAKLSIYLIHLSPLLRAF